MGLAVYVYDTSSSSTDPLVPGLSVNTPILDAVFGYTGVTSNLAHDSTNG